MKKVIAITEKEDRILTTQETAKKHNWWITHRLHVTLLINDSPSNVSEEPEVGNIIKGPLGGFYTVDKSEKVLICTICQSKGNFRIGFRFYCKKHYKHLITTKPIRRQLVMPNRNDLCICKSGKKFKNCCASKYEHAPRHYFASPYMADPKIVKSIENMVH